MQQIQPNLTEVQAKRLVPIMLLKDEQALNGTIDEFTALTIEEKLPYLTDVNKDGTINEKDAAIVEDDVNNATNPILKWAAEKYWKNLIVEDPVGKATKPTATKTPAEKDAARGIYTWVNKKYTVPSASRQSFGKTTYDSFYTYSEGNLSVTPNIPAGSILHGKTIDKPLEGKKSIKGTVLGYDAITKNVVFSVGDDYQVGAFNDVNNVSVPIDKLPPEYLELRIKTAEGIQTIGEAMGNTVTEKKTIGGF